MTNEEYLRFLLDDKIPVGGTDEETFFKDEDITSLLARHVLIYSAAADGWSMRAGNYHQLLDIDEGGSKRELSQLYKNAADRAKYFAKLAEDLSGGGGGGGAVDVSSGQRRVGVPVSLRESQTWVERTVRQA